ncbi:hypothetical protein D3C76_1133450 [compost metagenome]
MNRIPFQDGYKLIKRTQVVLELGYRRHGNNHLRLTPSILLHQKRNFHRKVWDGGLKSGMNGLPSYSPSLLITTRLEILQKGRSKEQLRSGWVADEIKPIR